MTMPNMMNCQHQPEGRCSACQSAFIEPSPQARRAADHEAIFKALESYVSTRESFATMDRTDAQHCEAHKNPEIRKRAVGLIDRANKKDAENAEFRATVERHRAEIVERETGVGEACDIIERLVRWQNFTASEFRLSCGELSAQDIRSIRAVLNAIAGTKARAYLAKNQPPVAESDLPKIPSTLPDGRYFWRERSDHHWSMVQVIGGHRLSGEVFSGMPFLQDAGGQLSRAYDLIEPEIGDALAHSSHQAREHYDTIKAVYETMQSKNQS